MSSRRSSNVGQASSYYDANGHYVRTQPDSFAFQINGANELVAQPPSQRYAGLTHVQPALPRRRREPRARTAPRRWSVPGCTSAAADAMRRLAAIVVAVLVAAIAIAVVADDPGAVLQRLLHGPRDLRRRLLRGRRARTSGSPAPTSARSSRSASTPATAPRSRSRSTTPTSSRSTPTRSCTIRPQSLIGEEYVNCSPGTSNHPPLATLQSGPGKGQHFLPVTRTSSPINTDIVQNISQMPVRQALGGGDR